MNVHGESGDFGAPSASKISGGDLSRRAFVRTAGGAVAVGMAATAGASQLFAGQAFAAPAATDRALFERCVGKAFTNKTLRASDLTLVKVRSLRFISPTVNGGDSFSLVFRGGADRPLDQGVYTLHHRTTGGRTLLVTPLQAEPNGRFYEVVFNRAVPR